MKNEKIATAKKFIKNHKMEIVTAGMSVALLSTFMIGFKLGSPEIKINHLEMPKGVSGEIRAGWRAGSP